MMTAAMPVRFAFLLAAAAFAGVAAQRVPDWTPEVPRVWDEAALADWATPVAGLMSSRWPRDRREFSRDRATVIPAVR